MEIAFTLLAALMLVALIGTFSDDARNVSLITFALLALAEGVIISITPQFIRRLKAGFTGQMAATSYSPQFPELQTRVYGAPPDWVVNAAAGVVMTLPRWRLLSTHPERGTIHAETRGLIVTEDVNIRVARAGQRQTRVDVISKSRSERADLGENRRNIAQFLTALDRKMNSVVGRGWERAQ